MTPFRDKYPVPKILVVGSVPHDLTQHYKYERGVIQNVETSLKTNLTLLSEKGIKTHGVSTIRAFARRKVHMILANEPQRIVEYPHTDTQVVVTERAARKTRLPASANAFVAKGMDGHHYIDAAILSRCAHGAHYSGDVEDMYGMLSHWFTDPLTAAICTEKVGRSAKVEAWVDSVAEHQPSLPVQHGIGSKPVDPTKFVEWCWDFFQHLRTQGVFCTATYQYGSKRMQHIEELARYNGPFAGAGVDYYWRSLRDVVLEESRAR